MKLDNFGMKISIMLAVLCDSMNVSIMVIILPFVVRFYLSDDYQNGVPDTLVSTYSGYLEAAFRLFQMVGALFWSNISSRYGCKYLILIGLFLVSITSLSISVSQSYLLTIISRSFMGFLTFYSGLLKGFIREITNDREFFEIYVYYSLGDSLSNLVSPLIVSLSNPSKSIGWIFDSPFFIENPYSLPLFLCAIIQISALVMNSIYLPHIKPAISHKNRFESHFANIDYFQTLSVYAIFTFIHAANRFIFSMICQTSEELGGFGLRSEKSVAFIQIFGSILAVFLPFFFQDFLVKKIGMLKSLFLAFFLFIFSSTIYPSFFTVPEPFNYILVVLSYGLAISSGVCAFSYCAFCIGNSVYSDQATLAHGYSTATAGLMRFLANSVFGNLFSYSISGSSEYLNARFSVYVSATVMSLALLYSMKFFESHLEKKKIRDQLLLNTNLKN